MRKKNDINPPEKGLLSVDINVGLGLMRRERERESSIFITLSKLRCVMIGYAHKRPCRSMSNDPFDFLVSD